MIERFPTLFCVLVVVATAPAAEVRLRSQAVCATSIARVSDIAEVFANDYRVAQSLAELPLCPAPATGRLRVLSQDDIRQLLELSGVERKSVTITGSESVTVSAVDSQHATTPVKQPLVASGVRQAVFEVQPQPTAKQPAARPAQPRNSQPDDPKPTASPPLIDKGVSLTVYARSSGVQITTSGKAIEAGGLGDMISVELADTKQRVMARVTAPQTVELTTGQTTEQLIPSAAKP